MDDDDIGQIRELAKARRDKRPKKKKKKKEKKEEKKLEKEGMGLQLLFGGIYITCTVGPQNSLLPYRSREVL